MLVVNDVGDVVLSDATTILALADHDRYTLVQQLRRLGAATVDELAAASGVTNDTVAGRLRILADVGLVTSANGRWQAVGHGLLLDVPADRDGELAARKLAGIMLLASERVPRDWAEQDESRLSLEWFQATGVINATMSMTPAELNALQEQIEALIAPYLNRASPPPQAADVHLLAYFLPRSRAVDPGVTEPTRRRDGN